MSPRCWHLPSPAGRSTSNDNSRANPHARLQALRQFHRPACTSRPGRAEYFDALIADRRQNLGDDILSDLIRAEEAGDRLSPTELLSQSVGLLIAGFETTIGLIGNGILALLRHPDQLALLRSRPELIATAIEECLRYDGPIALTARFLHEDAEFGGRLIPKDAQIWVMLTAANRDPARFPDPDRFDVRRKLDHHLAFGFGAHYCLGQALARLEGHIVLEEVLERFPEWNADLDAAKFMFHTDMRGYESLPVVIP